MNREAAIHLELARQFLAEGWRAYDSGSLNVSATLAINATIHAKDAICLIEVGVSNTKLPHPFSASELEKISNIGPELAASFKRILADKTAVEYGVVLVSKQAAKTALDRAERFIAKVVGQIGDS